MSVPKATLLACIVVDIDIPAVPSKFAVPTTSPDKAIALAVANAVAVEALPTNADVTWLNCTLSPVPTAWPIAKVTPLPEALELTPVPPNKDKVSESKSMAMVFEPSVMSKSWTVTWAST